MISQYVNTVFGVSGLLVLSSVFQSVLAQKGKEDQARMLSLVMAIIITLIVLNLLTEAISNIRTIFMI